MNLFSKKVDESENFEDYSTLKLPFLTENIIKEHNEKNGEAKEVEGVAEVKEIPVTKSEASPLAALKAKIEAETADEITPEVIKSPSPAPTEEKKPSERVSLLKRCMPYIYDENGVSQVEEKPDYVLESVDDIIRSAEKRANEKIAERYKLTTKNGKKIIIETAQNTREKSLETPSVLETPKPKTIEIPKLNEEKVALPKQADILFDDFSSKRTEVTDNESITTAYSKLTDLHTGIKNLN